LKPPAEPTWNPVAALCAWLLPGLGHWLIGEKRRAVILGGAIGALWLSGLLIGGLSIIDLQKYQWWFCGQMLTAPSVAVEGARHAGLIAERSENVVYAGHTGFWRSYEPSFGRPAEQGILYTALAGMLNLLAVIDVIYREDGARVGVPARAARAGPRGGPAG